MNPVQGADEETKYPPTMGILSVDLEEPKKQSFTLEQTGTRTLAALSPDRHRSMLTPELQ